MPLYRLEHHVKTGKYEDRAASNERGLVFLRDFKTARRHYEVLYPIHQVGITAPSFTLPDRLF